MRANGSHAQLTTKIDIKDKDGRKIGEKEVATYAGILALAHDEGLKSITTTLVQAPTKENGMVAIVTAVVRTNKGEFTGIGDSDPSNVNSRIVRHLIRMAETRSKARAMRDAVNIGIVSVEELGELAEEDLPAESARSDRPAPPRPRPQTQAANDNGRVTPPPNGSELPTATESEFRGMTEAQRGLLFRIAGERGITPPDAQAWLLSQLGVQDLRTVSRFAASQAIDRLKNGKPNGAGSPSGGNGTSAGAPS
ncbi:MAG: hypothetical protein JXQ75_00930 [Phycisphaerae bacterium]|nr:hypothetical protein [Phycisphaerae bacterium]